MFTYAISMAVKWLQYLLPLQARNSETWENKIKHYLLALSVNLSVMLISIWKDKSRSDHYFALIDDLSNNDMTFGLINFQVRKNASNFC